MILPGLCSVTLRSHSPREIVELARECGLSAIEWGGDIHVPHGGTKQADEVRRMCVEYGISTPSYGSYCRLDPECPPSDFTAALDSTLHLGAKTIRVWAGRKPSAEMDDDYRARLVNESRRLAELAAGAGCEIGFEYHRHTATDGNAEALALVQAVDHPAAKIYWQPRELTSTAQRLAGLRMILPKLCHLHVFHWVGEPTMRRPLSEGIPEWLDYLRLADSSDVQRCAYLEFVEDDSIENLRRDAASLLECIRSTDQPPTEHFPIK